MLVRKRNGQSEPVYFDKISSRIKKLCWNLDGIDPILISQKVIQGLYNGVTTTELDELASETCAFMSSQHPNYGTLAARIAVSNLHKNTCKNFSDVAELLYTHVEPKTKLAAPQLSQSCYQFIKDNSDVLNSAIVHDRDYNYDFFGFKTLAKSYLLKLNGKIVERPQHLLLRVACAIHIDNIELAIESYNLMSNKWFTCSSPTLFNAGTPTPQMSSCFLLTMKEDSIEGIFDTLKSCALISKTAGGIGLAIHNIRANGSFIRGTGGTSTGLVPMLKMFNNTATYVNQSGKRMGSFACFLEPWHADIFQFLDLKKNTGIEEHRARDLFYALWVPDLFMQRVEADREWSLFCPNEAQGLADCWGQEFKTLYESHEANGKARKVVQARDLWTAILTSQTETGTPYILYKDTCNAKSNQKHLGTIRSSNLCAEIIQYTSASEVAVCNLASISLPMFVENKTFNFQKLYEIAKVVIRNLNKVIDLNYYPVPEAKYSNLKHRPVGLGVQGLADAFILMRFPFDSKEAKQLNIDIFETLYFAACTASMELASLHGPYESYEGSPMSKGIFQFDMWNVVPSKRWDWTDLREKVIKHGMRNSLLIALMPTASSSSTLGNNECFEPYTSNIYTRRTLAGEFVCINKHLLHDLIERKLWNDEMKNKLIAHNGSVQNIDEIPDDLKQIYKTVWEIKCKRIIEMSADRGPFICQSQSLNVHMLNVTNEKLTSMHFYAWKSGLKTGMYYLRSKSASNPIQFTVDQNLLETKTTNQETKETKQLMSQVTSQVPNQATSRKRTREDQDMICTRAKKEDGGCVSCGS